MKTPLLYGCLMTLATALTTFALFFAGYHESPEKVQATQWVGTVVGIVAGVVFTWLAMRERRAEYPADKTWSYGSALGTGVLTAVVAAVTGAIVTYVYFSFINPAMADHIYQLQVMKMQAKGMSDDQIQRAAPMMKMFMSPGVMCAMQIVFGIVAGTVVSLIVAIFVRQPLPRFETAEMATPPPV